MTSLAKAIQERLAKICEECTHYPDPVTGVMHMHESHFTHPGNYKCAAAIRAADLSGLEPKEGATPRTYANLTRYELRLGEGRIQIDGEWCRADFARQLERELAALTARLEAAERGANRYKIIRNGDLPGYAIMPCDDENRDVSLDGDALDEAIDALKERK